MVFLILLPQSWKNTSWFGSYNCMLYHPDFPSLQLKETQSCVQQCTLFYLHTFTHCAVPPASLPFSATSSKARNYVGSLSEWAAHLFGTPSSSGVKQKERQSDKLDLSRAARSSRWQQNKQVRCFRCLSKKNWPWHGKSWFCSISL